MPNDEPRPRARIPLGRALVVIAIPFALLAVAVVLRAFDRLLHGPIHPSQALRSILAYALLALAATVLVLGDRRRRLAILLAAASIVASLVIAEIAVRLFHPDGGTLAFQFLFSPRVQHAMPKSATMKGRFVRGVGKSLTIVTNEDGFRSSRSRQDFLAARRRVAFLGDSYVFGLGLDTPDTVPAVTERLLAGRLGGDSVAVLNTGAISYSPFVERLLFDDVVSAYRPELVVMILDATDIGDDYAYAEAATNRGGAVSFYPTDAWTVLPDGPSLFDHSALYQRLYPDSVFWAGLLLYPVKSARIQGKASMRNPRLQIPGSQGSRFFIFNRPLEETRPYFEATLRNVAAVAASAKKIGARFLLAVAPRYQHWNPKECPRNWEANEYAIGGPYENEYLRFFDEVQASAGFPIMNLLPAFKASHEPALVFDTDPHWNEKGAALVAQAIVDHAIDQRLLEARGLP